MCLKNDTRQSAPLEPTLYRTGFTYRLALGNKLVHTDCRDTVSCNEGQAAHLKSIGA